MGALAEELAVGLLGRHGAEILARNVSVAGGEIDVLARIGPIRVAVEVRSRVGGRALDAFDEEKASRVWRLARSAGCTRVDLVAVTFHPDRVDLHWVPNVA